MKKHNPTTPLLVREAFGVPPKIYARYGKLPPCLSQMKDGRKGRADETEMGKESSVAVDGLSASQIEKALQDLAQKSA